MWPLEANRRRRSGGRAALGLVCALLFLLGVAGWLLLLWQGDADRAWRAMLINFLFFSALASGMVVWPAVVVASRGTWAGPANRTALAGIAFAPVSILAFVALWIGRAHWAAWMREPELHNRAWLNAPFLFGRDLAALLILWALAAWFVRAGLRERPKRLAGWVIFTYCMVWTLLGFDLVMALDPHWTSTLFGGYFFVSGMYIALVAWTLTVLIRQPDDTRRIHDLGKLIVAFSLLTAYMMYSQLLPQWYENFRHEVHNVTPRLNASEWRPVSMGLLATVYLGPLVLLLARRAKKTPAYLGAITVLLLAGMWVERWWLVTPMLHGPRTLGVTEATITVAMLAALIGGIGVLTARLPHPPPGSVMNP